MTKESSPIMLTQPFRSVLLYKMLMVQTKLLKLEISRHCLIRSSVQIRLQSTMHLCMKYLKITTKFHLVLCQKNQVNIWIHLLRIKTLISIHILNCSLIILSLFQEAVRLPRIIQPHLQNTITSKSTYLKCSRPCVFKTSKMQVRQTHF